MDKVINISTKMKKGGEAKQPKRLHPIKRRLVEMGGRRAGRTLEWLAKESGCDPQTIRNFMTGKTGHMLVIHYAPMLRTLGVTENYIYEVGEWARNKKV